MLYQGFTQSHNQEYEADNQEKLVQSSSLPQRDAWSPLRGGMLLSGARQHRNGATMNAAPQGAAAHPKDPGAMNTMWDPGKGKKKTKKEKTPCQQQERGSL